MGQRATLRIAKRTCPPAWCAAWLAARASASDARTAPWCRERATASPAATVGPPPPPAGGPSHCPSHAPAVTPTQQPLSVTQRALSVTQRALSVTQQPLSVTQRALSVTQRALSVTQRALSVTQRALSVTQEAHLVGAIRTAAVAHLATPREACTRSHVLTHHCNVESYGWTLRVSVRVFRAHFSPVPHGRTLHFKGIAPSCESNGDGFRKLRLKTQPTSSPMESSHANEHAVFNVETVIRPPPRGE